MALMARFASSVPFGVGDAGPIVFQPITSSLAKKRRELVAETAQDPCYSYSKLVIFLLFPLTIVYSFVLFHFLSLLFSKFEFRIRVSILLIDSIDIYWLWVNCNE